MKISEFAEFRKIVDSSRGYIWMLDERGKEYNLKSESDMRMVMTLLTNPDNGLELYASDPNAVFRLIAFLREQNKAA